MNHARIYGLLILVILGLAAGGAQAATCTLAATDINFGIITQLNSSPTDVQGSITVACQGAAGDLQGLPLAATLVATVDYQLVMDGGAAGNTAARAMTGPGATLSYNIFTDPSRQSVWGDGANGTSSQSGEFVFTSDEVLQNTPKSADHLSFARVPANANVPPGQYVDMVKVTLIF